MISFSTRSNQSCFACFINYALKLFAFLSSPPVALLASFTILGTTWPWFEGHLAGCGERSAGNVCKYINVPSQSQNMEPAIIAIPESKLFSLFCRYVSIISPGLRKKGVVNKSMERRIGKKWRRDLRLCTCNRSSSIHRHDSAQCNVWM